MLDSHKIHHLAQLARLKVSDTEAEHYATELTKVFGYLEELKTVNTADLQATDHLSGLANQLRDDKIQAWPQADSELLLQSVAKDSQGRVKVKKIM
jgi:aspartyl-tRNA(Asn)/glutamyl-tRNA(Gln) amidotransferase subunit C